MASSPTQIKRAGITATSPDSSTGEIVSRLSCRRPDHLSDLRVCPPCCSKNYGCDPGSRLTKAWSSSRDLSSRPFATRRNGIRLAAQKRLWADSGCEVGQLTSVVAVTNLSWVSVTMTERSGLTAARTMARATAAAAPREPRPPRRARPDRRDVVRSRGRLGSLSGPLTSPRSRASRRWYRPVRHPFPADDRSCTLSFSPTPSSRSTADPPFGLAPGRAG